MIKVWLAVFGVILLVLGYVGGIMFLATLMPNILGVIVVTVIGMAALYATVAVIAWKVFNR